MTLTNGFLLGARRALVAGAYVLGAAGACRAAVVLDSQTRTISAAAADGTGSGTQNKSAPGFGAWTDSVGVAKTKASGSASLDSTITTTLMHALGVTDSRAQMPSVTESTSASASARFRAAFTLTAATAVQYDASFPTHASNQNIMGFTHSAFVDLRDLTNAVTISHIQTAFGATDAPVSMSMTLPAGQYEIEAVYEHSGFGVRNTLNYVDFGSYDVTLSLVPGVGAVVALPAGLAVMGGRRRRAPLGGG